MNKFARTALAAILLLGLLLHSVTAISGTLDFHAARATQGASGGQSSDAQLAKLLKSWEMAENAIRDLRKVIRVTKDDRVFRTIEVTHVEVLGIKPNVVRIEWKDAMNRPTATLVSTGSSVRLFTYETRTEAVYALPDNFPAAYAKSDDWRGTIARGIQLRIQWPCLGFQVGQLAERFEVKLAGGDKHFAYLSLTPRTPIDRKEFVEMSIALGKTDFQPHKLRVRETNGSESTWDFTELATNLNPPVTLEAIQANLPQGWKKLE